MTRISATFTSALLGTLLLLFFSIFISTTANAEAEAKIFPLPPEVAEDLKLFGEGVVGKAVPAKPFSTVENMLNIGPGEWKYKILAGGDDGEKQRTETYEEIEPYNGHKAWKRTLGVQYVEYIHVDSDGNFVKYSEDALDVDYSADFTPGLKVPLDLEPGKTQTIETTITAFKKGKRGKPKFTGKSTAHMTYVGAYEITTPAGTWPAILLQTVFEIKIGPASVSDTTYIFVTPGVGRVAEVEVTNITAVLIYHAHTKIAKVLTEYPKH
jgi:hypothetical protein